MLKLPAGKFTVREREMLIGSGIVPAEFFAGKPLLCFTELCQPLMLQCACVPLRAVAKNPFVIGMGARE